MHLTAIFYITTCFILCSRSVLAGSIYRSSDDEKVCETTICKESAAWLQNAMNQSVDPCENFYEYACGEWIDKHPIPASETRYSTFDIVEEELLIQVQDVLTTKPPKPTKSISVLNSQNLYKGCLDESVREKVGVKPILELLDEFGGWPLLNPNDWDGSNYKWPDVVARLIRKLYLDALLIVSPGADDKNPDYNILFLDQPGFLAGRNEMVNMEKDDRTIEIIAAYMNYTLKSVELLGGTITVDTLEAVKDFMIFESYLAKLSRSSEERRDPESLYNKMTIAELQKNMSDPSVNWVDFLNTVLDGLTPVNNSTEVIVEEPDYLREMLLLVNNTDIKTVANYIGWKLVATVSGKTTAEFRDARFQFQKVVTGITEPPKLEKVCAYGAIHLFGFAIGRVYIEKYFGNEAKYDVENLVESLRKAYKQTLLDVKWMDDSTRQAAIEKLESIISMMAYPEWIMDDTKLDEYYENVPVLNEKAYFKSFMNTTIALITKDFRGWNQKTNRTTEWLMEPPVVNAAYNPVANTITFPAGILKTPFYQYGRIDALNYGGIGMVIGHEMSHGFDDNGRHYDKNGMLSCWWSNNTIKEFKDRAQCFVDQYNTYVEPITGLNLNGENTIGENIADNGAIRNAYKAYHLYLKESGKVPERLPNLNATSDQLFFLGFATGWCSLAREEFIRAAINYDEHSPAKYRVMVPLSNFEEFAKAYNCPIGSPMNPTDKCILW